MTVFDYCKYYLTDVLQFFQSVTSLFPPVVISLLFFFPAITIVFSLIRTFRDAFRG